MVFSYTETVKYQIAKNCYCYSQFSQPEFVQEICNLFTGHVFLSIINLAYFLRQVFSLLGGTFKDHSAAAFALYKLLQQTATGIAFCYSPLLLLHWQLLIAVVFGGMGTAAFCIVEHNQVSKERP